MSSEPQTLEPPLERGQPPGSEATSPHPTIAILARWMLKLFYGSLEVRGLDQVPTGRPLVLAANHVNSLVDGALLLACMPSPPRLLGTSELWNMPILKPFLAWAAAIPVYRRSVKGFDPSKNQDTFARCHEVLAAGGHIGILPEGTSHNEPALVRIRTGVSRIVLEAEAKFGPLGTRIVPVGFTFEDRTEFRSAALVQIGEPIDPVVEMADYREQPREAVKALTERVRQALESLTLNFRSWEDVDLIERAAEIYQRPSSGSPPLSGRVEMRRAFITGYAALQAERPAEVEPVAKAVRRYDALLREHRLTDAQIAATYPPDEVLRFTLRSLWLLLVRLPLGLAGMVLHWLPFQAASLAAKKLSGTPDRLATYKILGSMVFYLVTWVATAMAAGWLWGWPAALLALVLAPASGGVALRLYLRGRLFWNRARGFFLMRSRKPFIAELRRLRGEAERAIEELVAVYERR